MLNAAGRNLIGSDAIIIGAIVMHMFEGALLMSGNTSADWTYPFRAFLFIGFGTRWLAALILIASASLAIIGEWHPTLPPALRLMALMPQFTLLCMTSLWVMNAAAHGMNALHNPAAPIAIVVNQFHRIGLPLFYAISVRARLRDEP